MTRQLVVAAAKGYLLEKAVSLLEEVGITFEEDILNTRKLFMDDATGTVRVLIIRPWDVPVYVAKGAADIGVVGKDVLLEHQADVIDLLDLKFGGCKLVIAGPEDADDSIISHNITVATKYPTSAERYFTKKGLKVSIVKLYGAIELAPITGLADVICDLTATGTTLRENKLRIIDTVFDSTAHLIANKVGFKVHYDRIRTLVDQLKTIA